MKRKSICWFYKAFCLNLILLDCKERFIDQEPKKNEKGIGKGG